MVRMSSVGAIYTSLPTHRWSGAFTYTLDRMPIKRLSFSGQDNNAVIQNVIASTRTQLNPGKRSPSLLRYLHVTRRQNNFPLHHAPQDILKTIDPRTQTKSAPPKSSSTKSYPESPPLIPSSTLLLFPLRSHAPSIHHHTRTITR